MEAGGAGTGSQQLAECSARGPRAVGLRPAAWECLHHRNGRALRSGLVIEHLPAPTGLPRAGPTAVHSPRPGGGQLPPRALHGTSP